MGWVYFIRDGADGPIKIGYTTRPMKHRLAELQSATHRQLVVQAVVPGTREAESQLHDRFTVWRLSGEWFGPCADLVNLAHCVAVAMRHNSGFAYDWSVLGRYPPRLQAVNERKEVALDAAGWGTPRWGGPLGPDALALIEYEASTDDDLYLCPSAWRRDGGWARLRELNLACSEAYEAHNYAVEHSTEGSQVH